MKRHGITVAIGMWLQGAYRAGPGLRRLCPVAMLAILACRYTAYHVLCRVDAGFGSRSYIDNVFVQAPGPGEPADCRCAEDFDCDGVVGFADLTALLAAWGPCPDCRQDVDGDGDVGFSDLTTLLAVWGPCP